MSERKMATNTRTWYTNLPSLKEVSGVTLIPMGHKPTSFKVTNFKLSRGVLSAKRKQLVVERGSGNRPQVSREVTAVEEDKLFAEGEFGEHNPVALQRTV